MSLDIGLHFQFTQNQFLPQRDMELLLNTSGAQKNSNGALLPEHVSLSTKSVVTGVVRSPHSVCALVFILQRDQRSRCWSILIGLCYLTLWRFQRVLS